LEVEEFQDEGVTNVELRVRIICRRRNCGAPGLPAKTVICLGCDLAIQIPNGPAASQRLAFVIIASLVISDA
jgi:hypothetical protein